MIKRLAKSKKSKKGAILVIVVLILALAMIFIASAMMLTQATRRRLYSTTMQSQARLTVTAASEVFLEALKMQEITDTQLEAIMGKTHGAGKQKVKMVVENVPGMSTAADNCTYLDVYPDPTDSTFVYCDFTTVIGNETENVQVVLKAEESDPSFGSQFKNQIEVAGAVEKSELRFTEGCGMWDSTKITRPTDNNIVIRKTYWGQTSGSKYISDVVFGQGSNDIQLGGGEMFFGRMIFLQGAKMYNRSSAKVYGDIYCIGTDNSAGLKVNSGDGGMWDNIKDQNNKFIFSGRSAQNDTDDGNKKIMSALTSSGRQVYFLDSSGKSLGTSHANLTARYGSGESDTYKITNKAGSTGSTVSGITANVERYQKYNYTNSGSTAFPSASTVFSKLCVDGKTAVSDGSAALGYETYTTDGTKYSATAIIPAGKKFYVNPITTSYPTDAFFNTTDSNLTPRPEKKSLDLSTASSQDLAAGYYYVTGSCTGDSTDPIVLGIDGSQGDKYRFYFAKNTKFLLRGVIFAIYNANPEKPVIVVLEDGAKIQLSHNNDSGSTNVLCTAGFLSVPTRPNFKTFAEACSYITSNTWSTEKRTVKNNEYKDKDGTQVTCTYSQYYDNVTRPCFFIYGAANNIICLGPNVNIEAYVGLYGGGGFGPIDGTSDTAHQQIYGRVECNTFRTYLQDGSFGIPGWDNPVGGFAMPYCPQPLSVSTIPDQRLAVSKYHVADIIYYYDGTGH